MGTQLPTLTRPRTFTTFQRHRMIRLDLSRFIRSAASREVHQPRTFRSIRPGALTRRELRSVWDRRPTADCDWCRHRRGRLYLVSAARDRAGWRRSQSTRWDETRAQAYADYARAVKSLCLHCMRMTNSGGITAPPESTDTGASLAELDRLAGQRTAVWELVLLLGDPDAIAAGRIWHRRVGLLEILARCEQADAVNYRALLDDIDSDRARFYQAARRDLGVQSGDVPLGGPWDLDVTRYAVERQPRASESPGVDQGARPTPYGESPDRPAEAR